MFTLFSGRHVGAHRTSDVHQHGVSILSSVNCCETFRRISAVWENAQTLNLEKCLLYLFSMDHNFLTLSTEWLSIYFFTAWQWKRSINLVQFWSQMQSCTANLHALPVVYFIRTIGFEVYRNYAICSMSSMIIKLRQTANQCATCATSKPAKRFICMHYSSHAMKLILLTLHLAKAKEDLNRRVLLVSWTASLQMNHVTLGKRNLRVSVSKNQAKSEISGKNVKIQICSNSGYW